jgi:hypothetical protein
MFAVLRQRADAAAGLCAAALTLVVLLISAMFQTRSDRVEAAREIASDDSYIAAIAEDMLWQQSAATPDEQAASGAPAASVDRSELPPGISEEQLPAELLQAAAARWHAMPEAERKKIRDTRQRWLSASQGESLEDLQRGPSWTSMLSVAALSSAVALLVASWPALAARFVFGER